MVDPTSDLEADVDEESAPRCVVCGGPALGVGRRTLTWVDDGELERRQFCSQVCRDDWADERPTT